MMMMFTRHGGAASAVPGELARGKPTRHHPVREYRKNGHDNNNLARRKQQNRRRAVGGERTSRIPLHYVISASNELHMQTLNGTNSIKHTSTATSAIFTLSDWGTQNTTGNRALSTHFTGHCFKTGVKESKHFVTHHPKPVR
eukprot:scaffold382_cov380-Prasinococcus_capsulatus_cf.AAC.37